MEIRVTRTELDLERRLVLQLCTPNELKVELSRNLRGGAPFGWSFVPQDLAWEDMALCPSQIFGAAARNHLMSIERAEQSEDFRIYRLQTKIRCGVIVPGGKSNYKISSMVLHCYDSAPSPSSAP